MSTSTVDRRRYQSALDIANEIRLARSELRHKIASGEVFASSVILDPPREAQTWEIGEVLLAQRWWGPPRMRSFLARLDTFAPIPETKPAGALTDRQRHLLADALHPTESEDA